MKFRTFFTLLFLAAFVVAIGFFYQPAPLKRTFSKKVEKESVVHQPTWSQFSDLARLKLLIKGLGIQTLIDLPAQDIKEFAEASLPIAHYIGGTKTQDEAKGLQVLYGSQTRSFSHLQLGRGPLPKADLILCWDELSRLPREEVQGALLQIKKSGAKYLMVYHHPEMVSNQLIDEQNCGPINWKLPPFCFPEPIIQLADPKTPTRTLSLWSVSAL